MHKDSAQEWHCCSWAFIFKIITKKKMPNLVDMPVDMRGGLIELIQAGKAVWGRPNCLEMKVGGTLE